jgi:arginine-tRNA-protein transferase
LREDGQLLAVAVTDVLPDALSAVYTFYDPALASRGLGTLAILRQLEWARRDGHSHLYLGYWIDGHRKMDYKRSYRPLEQFDGRRWRELES